MSDYRTDQSSAWGTLIVVLLVVIAILLMGYFAWWAPAHRETTVINVPGKERDIVPVPSPQPSQPAGPAAPSAPSSPASGGSAGTQ